ncbi:hypothetical protein [Chitinophaga sp.]|uniref:hypothetical protein n=1 Tax=Chitinophaga sp. TaxID=1869181 RepID=UPI0031D61134
MRSNLTLAVLAFICLFFSFCTRDSSEYPDAGKLKPANQLADLDFGKQYNAISCTIGNCIGTKCEATKGNSCKKEADCIAIAGGCKGGGGGGIDIPTFPPTFPHDSLIFNPDTIIFTPDPDTINAEIEILATNHATELLKAGIIDEKGVQRVKTIARQALIMARKK